MSLFRRIVVTIGTLLLIRFGCVVPLPGVNLGVFHVVFERHAALQLFNLLYGGGLRHFSIAALGVFPFLCANNLFRLTVILIPMLSRLAQGDTDEKRHFRTISRISDVIFTALFAFGIGWLLLHSAQNSGILEGTLFWPGIGLLVTGATACVPCFWFIAHVGIGQGARVMMAMGILGEYAYHTRQVLRTTVIADVWQPALLVVSISAVYMAAAFIPQFGVINVPVQYAERVVGGRTYGGQSTHLPIHLLHDSLVPVYSCLEMLLLGALLIGVFQRGGICNPVSFGNVLLTPVVAFPLCFIFLAVYPMLFRRLKFSPTELAENMKRYGGYIPGVRPGKRTAAYLDGIMMRLALPETIILLGLLTFPGVMFWLTGWNPGISGLSLFVLCRIAFSLDKRLLSFRRQKLERYLEYFVHAKSLRGRR